MEDGQIVVNFGGGIVFGIIVALIASSRGRNPVGWFFVGFFLSCIGIVLVLVFPDLKQVEARERRLSTENRRLRERLDKDRQVADRRHRSVERRLSSHDRALGTDTSEPDDALLELSDDTAASLSGTSGEWYYVEADDRRGPVGLDVLEQMFDGGQIDASTLIWCQGMGDWAELRDVDVLARRFGV